MAEITDTLNTINFSGAIDTTGTYLLYIALAVTFGAIIWFILHQLSFKHTVVIKEPVGNTFNYSANKVYKIVSFKLFDKKQEPIFPELPHELKIFPYIATIYKAKIIVKNSIKYLKLKGLARLFKIPDQVFQAITHKGKKYIELTKLSEHIYAPTVLTDSQIGETMYLYDESIFAWVVNDIEADHKKYGAKTFWDKYGNIIAVVILLIVILIIVVFTLKYSNDIVQNAIQAVNPLVNALVESTKQITSQKV